MYIGDYLCGDLLYHEEADVGRLGIDHIMRLGSLVVSPSRSTFWSAARQNIMVHGDHRHNLFFPVPSWGRDERQQIGHAGWVARAGKR